MSFEQITYKGKPVLRDDKTVSAYLNLFKCSECGTGNRLGHHGWEPFPGGSPSFFQKLRWRLIRPYIRWKNRDQ